MGVQVSATEFTGGSEKFGGHGAGFQLVYLWSCFLRRHFIELRAMPVSI
jgi:hypothetical protein